MSGKVVAGAAAAVAGVAAAAVAATTSSGGQQESRPAEQPVGQPEGTVQPQEVTVVDQPPPDAVVRDDVLVPESDAEGYTAPSSTEGVERSVRGDGDDPMIGGGSQR